MRTFNLIFALLFGCSANVSSAYQLNDQLSLRGFGSLGATTSTADEMGYRPSLSSSNPVHDGQLDLSARSLLGLQADMVWSDHLSSTVQLVLKDRPEDTLAQAIQLATLSYTPDPHWQLQLGRFSPRAHLLTEYRNVGYGILWAEPPSEFYGPIQSIYVDGLSLTYKHPWQDGTLAWGLDVGTTEILLVDEASPTVHAKLSPVASLSAEYSDLSWLWRASFSYLHNASDWEGIGELRNALQASSGFWPEATDLAQRLHSKDTGIYFVSLGMDYSGQHWGVRSELSSTQSDSELIPDSVASYISLAHFMDEYTPYVRLAHIQPLGSAHTLRTTPPAPLRTLADQALNAVNTDFHQTSLALGIRWDLHPKAALKLQWERSWIKRGGAGLWWNAEQTNQHRVDTLMLNLDFIF